MNPKLNGYYCKSCGTEIYLMEELDVVYCPRCLARRKKRRMFKVKDEEEENEE